MMNACVTEATCRDGGRGVVDSGNCVAPTAIGCAQDSGLGFNSVSGLCVPATMASCMVAGVRFAGGRCQIACDPGEGLNASNMCVMVSSLSGLSAQVEACQRAGRLHDDSGTATCVDTGADCPSNGIRGRAGLNSGGVSSEFQCIAASECVGANHGVSSRTCVDASSVSCRGAGSSTYYFDTMGGCVTSCTMGGRTLTRNRTGGNDCVAEATCRVNGAVSSGDCLVASGVNCNADGARAVNGAETGCVVSCIANDGGRGRNSAHECVTATAGSCRLAGGDVNNMGFFDTSTSACVQAVGDCASTVPFGDSGGGGNRCVADCSTATHGVNSNNLCVATNMAEDCIRAERLLQGSNCTETCTGETPIYNGRDRCVTVERCANSNQGLSTAAVTRFGREIASEGACVAASPRTCYNVGNTTQFYEPVFRSCEPICTVRPDFPLKRSVNMMNSCVEVVDCRDSLGGAVVGPEFGGQCLVASGVNCNADRGRAFNDAETGCVVSCITGDGGRGRNSAHECVAATDSSCRLAGGDVDSSGFFDTNTSRCVQTAAECSGGRFAEGGSGGNSCVRDCSDVTQGVNSSNLCVATSMADDCIRAERLLRGSSCTETCGGAAPYYDGTDTCVTRDACLAVGQGISRTEVRRFSRRIASSGSCVTASAATCYNAGTTSQFFDSRLNRCVTSCSRIVPLRRSVNMMNACVTAATCRADGTMAAVLAQGNCVVATAQRCFDDGGRGFAGSVCVTPDADSDCSDSLNLIYDGDSLCIVGSFIDIAVGSGASETAITSKADALALFTGDKDNGSDIEKNIRTEYQNQPALALVGAAEAYVSEVASSGEDISNLNQLNLGDGSQISVITTKRFDPNHPEFSSSSKRFDPNHPEFSRSSDDPPFRTITRFRVDDESGNDVFGDEDVASQNVLRLFFGGDTEGLVQVYSLLARTDSAQLTVSVGEINGMPFEDISRDEFAADDADGVAIRNDIQTFFRGIVGGGRFITGNGGEVRKNGEDYIYSLDRAGNYFIRLVNSPSTRDIFDNIIFSHLGRIYDSGGNLASYEIVLHPFVTVRDDDSEGECITDNSCYSARIIPASPVPAAASDAEMGVLALINGMLDGAGGAANTHGIAPGATLKVITGVNFGNTNDGNPADVIYRARGIDVARDRDANNNFVVDTTRNIVIIQNVLHPNQGVATLEAINNNVNFRSTGRVFRALNAGIVAPVFATEAQRAAQDIYVFVAEDDRTTDKDPGVLASLSLATPSNFEAYSVIVVAAEDGANAFCGTVAADICLAAPGSYRYRTRETDGSYTSTTLATVTKPTSNAAASLVAGGFAILEERFGAQMGSDELVARMLATTSQCFNFDDLDDPAWDGSSCTSSKNDYVGDKASPTEADLQTQRFGRGLLDLECATRPITDANDPRCRHATGDSPSSCLGNNQGFDGVNCVTSSITAGDCVRANGVLSGSQCIARSACASPNFVNVADDMCVAACEAGEGAVTSPLRRCTQTANNNTCMNVTRRFDVVGGVCRADNNCGAGQFVGEGTLGVNSCYTLRSCLDNGGGLSALGGGGNCVVASVTACRNAGSWTYDSGDGVCVINSHVDVPVGAGKAGEVAIDTKADALGLFTGDSTAGTDLVKNIRSEYQNQPSLALVGAADAYVSQVASSSADIRSLHQLTLGDGSQISVITDKRFDPNHPEFSSSLDGAVFRTLTRFQAEDGSSNANAFAPGPGSLLYQFFAADIDQQVEVYQTEATGKSVYFSVPVGDIDGVAFETISRSDFGAEDDTGRARRTALQTFFRSIVGGGSFIASSGGEVKTIDSSPFYTYVLDDADAYQIFLSRLGFSGFQQVGRVYDSGNFDSYQVVLGQFGLVRVSFSSGECIVNSGCYSADVPVAASAAEMGVLALINGMLDGAGGTANTHGIAPGARLKVLTTGLTDMPISADLVYRARGIDVGRGFANPERNIVIIQNGIVDPRSKIGAPITLSTILAGVKDFNYENLFEALNFNVVAPADASDDERAVQDIYVFAAQDNRATSKDVGLLAAMPGWSGLPTVTLAPSRFKAYSVAVVAAEGEANAFCGSFAAEFCLAAPGAYRYRTRESDGSYTSTTLALGAATSNAAVSLVAGGFAILEERFGTQLSSDELVARMLATASQCFNIDGKLGNPMPRRQCNNRRNDYVSDTSAPTALDVQTNRYGQGLLDLECATRPSLTQTRCREYRTPTLNACIAGMRGFDGSFCINCVGGQGLEADGTCTNSPTQGDCERRGLQLDGTVCVSDTAVLDVAVTGIDTRAKALSLFTGDADTGTNTVKNIRTEYQNQPALALVGAAQAYTSGVDETGADITNLNQLNLGKGSAISVVTNKRFDPNHPEFSTSRVGAPFRTLTRFYAEDTSGNNGLLGINANVQNFLRDFFGGDTDQLVEMYRLSEDVALARNRNSVYFTVPVGTINSMQFEDISRDDFAADADGVAIRNAVQTFFRDIVGGGRFIVSTGGEVTKDGDDYSYNLDTMGAYLIQLIDDSDSRLGFNHVGRIYDTVGNLVSYQVFLPRDAIGRDDDDSGECIVNNRCYGPIVSFGFDVVVGVPEAASDAEMGVLALINGLLDGAGGTANTHGIAPGATLKVIATFKFGEGHSPADVIYRARGIDFGRGRDSDGTLIADTKRNIVIIQNGLAVDFDPVTLTAIHDIIGFPVIGRGVLYDEVFEALNLGAKAPADATEAQRAAQDIYVFAARDSRATEEDPGVLASLPVATPSNFEAYSVVVVAAESGANAFCGTLTVDLCLAAPGAYRYRTRERDGRYTSTTLATVTTPTSNAAASLVAGGFAILEERFGEQMGSDELVARMLATTSQCFNINGTAGAAWDGSACDSSKNDFVGDTASPTAANLQTRRYGQGLMDLECATRPSLTQDRCRPAGVSASSCLATNHGFDGWACVTSGIVAGDCVRAGGVLSGSQCIARSACASPNFINVAVDTCAATCGTGEGAVISPTRRCTQRANSDTCMNVTRRFDVARGVCRDDNTCGAGEFLGSGSLGANSCYTLTNCIANGGGLSAIGSGNCAAASVTTCFNAGTLTYDSGDGVCVATSLINVPVGRGKTGETSVTNRTEALGLFTGDATAGTDTVKNIRTEYQNQPSLGQVGAAQAYVSQVATSGADVANLSQLSIGNGSQISVITSKRFDPNHPAFSSADGAEFRTLTRFNAEARFGSGLRPFAGGIASVFSQFFPGDDDNEIELYELFSRDSGTYLTVSVGQIAGMNFEDISRNDFNADGSVAIRNAVEAFLRGLVGSTGGGSYISDDRGRIVVKDSLGTDVYDYHLDDDGNYLIYLSDGGGFTSPRFNHVGRVYASGNLIGYQIILGGHSTVRDDGDEGECVVNNSCYGALAPAAASAAEMGVLALINGLLDGAGGAANTHGIAPGATLNVVTTRGELRSNAEKDVLYRARGIDVARDRDDSDNVIADSDRNIVIIQNNRIANTALARGAVGSDATAVDAAAVSSSAYRNFYAALQTAVRVPEDSTAAELRAQDIYVFAAADNRATHKDVGLLAALPGATSSKFKAYAVTVVAAESAANAFCGSFAAEFCLAAPGAFKYRDRDSTTGDYADSLSDATATSNAAASLVAGGIAILEEIFGSQMGSHELVARVLTTASQCFNIDGAAGVAWDGNGCDNGKNDYAGDRASSTEADLLRNRYGQGLLDLECATRPSMTQTRCRIALAPVDADDIIEVLRGTGNTDEADTLIDSSSFTDTSTTIQKRQREYANQAGLDAVGAAFAYAKVGDGELGIAAAIAKAGAGSNISVITNKRFDPTHPEFTSSASDATFQTLVQFNVINIGNYMAGRADSVASLLFADDSNQVADVYTGNLAGDSIAYFSVPVGQITGMNFEDISHDEVAASAAIRLALVNGVLVPIVTGGTAVTTAGDTYIVSGNAISISSAAPHENVGRIYDSGNIVSYQIITSTANGANNVRDDDDEGECIANNDCYSASMPSAASGAEMGVLALINGLANPSATGVAYNTHGIAPGAQLSVITTLPFAINSKNHGVDLIYRARGINAGYDRDDSDNVIADTDRNIVIIQDGIADNLLTQAATVANVDDAVGLSGSSITDNYKSFFGALKDGLADTDEQDAYVFTAREGGADDVGLLAALAIATGAGFAPYSIIAVAAESGATQCGSLAALQALCLAAPGSYKYRNRMDDGTYETDLSDGTVTANAAASLVAGGLALLESIFPTETTARLIDRLLMTASKNYDLDDNDANDYSAEKHGQGLMDLACAIKPALSATLDRTGCVNRNNPVGMSAPQQKPEDKPIEPKGFAQGEPVGKDVNTNKDDTSIDYCDIDGLRIILSGDLCSSDYILLADKEGKLQPETIGNLRFGMGFGDALAGAVTLGGITFFDAFDTAWTVDNPYNPYAHLLDISNIVIAPAESRFDIDDRFYAMRYGTRPGTRKVWASDTARITMDFATQGMATKPYAVTRGQIRNTISHDNMGADPYAEVRFMLSAEDRLGDGRLKVMTYSGMAMGYTLGLHAQGDAMMPSYLLTNRDSFHAPYLSLASSGLGGGVTYRFRDGGHIGFVMGEGTSLNADGTLPYQQQTSRPRAFAGMMEYAPHKNLMFQMGALQEENTLLASQGSGLFDIEGGATAFVGVQAKQPIADNWQALFSGYSGRTQLGGSRGIVSGLDVVTTSFDVGLLGSHLLERGDHVLLRAGQPMRVESGSLDLSYVSFRNKSRSSVSNVQRFDVAPSMRSVEFGVGYGMPMGQNGRGGHVRFAIDYVLNPGHRRVRDEVFGIMSFRREF